MLLVNADSVLRFVSEILQFAALLLGLFFVDAVIARVFGPRPDGDEPPASISG